MDGNRAKGPLPAEDRSIQPADIDDAALLAGLIRESHRDVALQFGLTSANCPKHPSFCTEEWIKSDFARGAKYFILSAAGQPAGCVAYEKPKKDLAYLNRLSVLPSHRGRGFGTALVSFVLDLARRDFVRTVSIGVIGEYRSLQDWYRKRGFTFRENKRFPHLPFSVTHMAAGIELD